MKKIILMFAAAVMSIAVMQSADAQNQPSTGDVYTEISAKDTNGNTVSLSSVVGSGKWVLVDFWATWCGPCRGEIPYLKEAYAKYAGKGFVIYGVSLDDDKDAWREFVKENGMTWTNVNEPWRGSKAASNYGVEAIPSNFLISPEGKIVATNLRGAGVEKKLEEVLGSGSGSDTSTKTRNIVNILRERQNNR